MLAFAQFHKQFLGNRRLPSYTLARGRSFGTGHVYQQAAHFKVDQGSCVAHAAANCLEILTGRLRITPDHLYERSKEIAQAKGWAEATQSGASLDATALALEELSFVRATVRLQTETQMLDYLANQGPFVLGLHWTEDMQFAPGSGSRRYLPAPTEYSIPLGHHAVAAIGLTNPILAYGSPPRWLFLSKKPRRLAEHLIIENSHGIHWGNKGRALLETAHLPKLAWGGLGIITQ